MRRCRWFFVKVWFRINIPKEPKIKQFFQEQSERPKHWFDLDIEWGGEDFSTRYTQFYNRLFQTNIEGKAGITYPIYTVPVGIVK